MVRFEHWSRLAEVCSLTFDVLVEGLYQGRLASMPGQVVDPTGRFGGFESVDALGRVGRDRRISPGLEEPSEQYAQRLRGWRISHRRAGVGPWVLAEIQAVLRPDPPLVRYVTALGRWWSREAGEGAFTFYTESGDGFELAADGVIPDGGGSINTAVAHGWNWGSGDPFEFFPIIYPGDKIEPALLLGDPELILGTPGQTLGSTASLALVELVRAQVNQFRPSGMLPPVIIIAFDETLFDPAAPFGSPDFPDDGDWALGYDDVVDGDGDLIMVPVRPDNSRACFWVGKEPEELP